MTMERTYGTVRTMRKDRGFVFVQSDVVGVRLFAHASSFTGGELAFAGVDLGTRLSFIATMGERGPRAEAVEIEA
jgi:cold shock CspA family protein